MSNKFIVDYAALGAKIRSKRDSMRLSQDAVSEKLDLSESFYGHIERGDRVLSVESLVKIANYFNLSLDYLLLDSTDSGMDEKFQTELDDIFRDKNSSERAYLLNLLKVLSENVEKLMQSKFDT